MTDEGETGTQTTAARPTDQQSVAQTQDAEQRTDDRPKPYPHDGAGESGDGAAEAGESSEESGSDSSGKSESGSDDGGSDDGGSSGESESGSDDGGSDEVDDRDLSEVPLDELPEPEKPDVPGYGEDEEQGYVDRDAIDFDPADGLYSGTAVDGGETELPDPPSDDHVKAAFEDIKSGGDGLVDEEGNKVENRQDADDDD